MPCSPCVTTQLELQLLCSSANSAAGEQGLTCCVWGLQQGDTGTAGQIKQALEDQQRAQSTVLERLECTEHHHAAGDAARG